MSFFGLFGGDDPSKAMEMTNNGGNPINVELMGMKFDINTPEGKKALKSQLTFCENHGAINGFFADSAAGKHEKMYFELVLAGKTPADALSEADRVWGKITPELKEAGNKAMGLESKKKWVDFGKNNNDRPQENKQDSTDRNKAEKKQPAGVK